MLEKCKKVLLISDVKAFSEMYKNLALDIGVELEVSECWNQMYRLNADIVILGSKHLEELNVSYYASAVLILKEGESPAPYMKLGISRFIFDYTNKYELLVGLCKNEKIVVHSNTKDLKTIIKDSGTYSYCFGDYDFHFDTNRYNYKGKAIYLSEANKRYLAEWLLNGSKDNKKRMSLANMRKRFGSDFLRDIDRFGQMRRTK